MSGQPHLLHIFSTFAAGGPQVRTTDLMNAMAADYRHTVVAMDGCFDARGRVAADVAIEYRDPPPRGPAWKMPLRLGAMMKDVGADLVLTYNWGAIESLPAAALARRPVLHAEDGFGADEVVRLKRRRSLFRRGVFRLARAVVVPSRNLERIVTRVWRNPTARTFYIPNGIDTDQFSPGDGSTFRRSLGLAPGDLVIGTVAKLRAEKGLEFLIDAFAALSGERRFLLIVGDGPEEAKLRRRAEAVGAADRVFFAGALLDPAPAYRAMDLFALSSHTEQMPISVVEAMACGLPVLSTDVGDVRHMIAEPVEGAIVARAPEAYRGALARLLQDRELRCALGVANRARCLEHFQRAVMVQRYRALYESVRTGAAPRIT